MPAPRPVPTSDQINAAILRAKIGQGRALLKLLRTMPEADILAGLDQYGLDGLRFALQHAAGRMKMRAELRAARKVEIRAVPP